MFMVAGAIFRALIRSDIYKKIVIQPFEFLSGSLTHNKSEAKKRIIKSPADQNGPQVCCSHKIKSILSVYCLKFAIHPVIIVQSAVFNLQSALCTLLSALCIVFPSENKNKWIWKNAHIQGGGVQRSMFNRWLIKCIGATTNQPHRYFRNTVFARKSPIHGVSESRGVSPEFDGQTDTCRPHKKILYLI